MSSNRSDASGDSFDVLAAAAIALGAFVVAYGLSLAAISGLAAAHIAAIGLALLLAGVFATEWAGRRFDLSASDQRRLATGLAALALLLLVLYVIINGATFSSGEAIGE